MSNLYYLYSSANQLKKAIIDKDIIILDLVKDELNKGDDELSVWIKQFDNALVLNHVQAQIINIYSEILQHIQRSEFYKEKALLDWSKGDVADPWLIAAASTYNYKIVTFETKNANLNSINKCSRAKIPDIGEAFGIECVSLYNMMRNLNFII